MALLQGTDDRTISSKDKELTAVDDHLIDQVMDDLACLQRRGRRKMNTWRLLITPTNCRFRNRLTRTYGYQASKIELDEYTTAERMEHVVRRACEQFRGRQVVFVSVAYRTADCAEDLAKDPKCKQCVDTDFVTYTVTFYPG